MINDTKARFWGEPFWNENTCNGFLPHLFITCSHSGIARMVVYAIPCTHAQNEQNEKVVNPLAIRKWLSRTTAHSRQV